jgi:hypothetical protein
MSTGAGVDATMFGAGQFHGHDVSGHGNNLSLPRNHGQF